MYKNIKDFLRKTEYTLNNNRIKDGFKLVFSKKSIYYAVSKFNKLIELSYSYLSIKNNF